MPSACIKLPLEKHWMSAKENLLGMGYERAFFQSLHLEMRLTCSRNPPPAFCHILFLFPFCFIFSCEMFAHLDLCILNTTEGGRCSKQKV